MATFTLSQTSTSWVQREQVYTVHNSASNLKTPDPSMNSEGFQQETNAKRRYHHESAWYETNTSNAQHQNPPKRFAPDAQNSISVQCECGDVSIILESKTTKNPGRKFYRCAKTEGKCNFFKWTDDEHPVLSSLGPNPSPGIQPYNQLGHNSTPKGNAWQDPSKREPCWDKENSGEGKVIYCTCGVPSRVTMAKTANNYGRFFFSCPKDREDPARCSFFQWEDGEPTPNAPVNSALAANPLTNSQNGGGNGACYLCQQPGHFSRDCPQKATQGAGGNGSSSGTCFKCGQPGHWSRDCPNSGGSGYATNSTNQGGHGGTTQYGRGRAGSNTSGRGGGWNFSGAAGVAAASGERGNAGKAISGSCYKCGQSGHWARDCLGQ